MDSLPNHFQPREVDMRITAKAVLAYRTKNDGTAALLLQVILNGAPVRFILPYCIPVNQFKNGRVTAAHPDHTAINLVIEKAKSRITEISSSYYLNDRHLTPDSLRREFSNVVNRKDFIAFARQERDVHALKVTRKTIEQHDLAIDKLEKFRPQLLFCDLTEELVERYVHWEKTILGNHHNTVNKTLTLWKFYIHRALRRQIKFQDPFEHIKISDLDSQKVALTKEEYNQLLTYYRSAETTKAIRWHRKNIYSIGDTCHLVTGGSREARKWISKVNNNTRNAPPRRKHIHENEYWKEDTDFCTPGHRHVLRYFLFSCRSGLRISDVSRLSWESIHDDRIKMVMHKNRNSKHKLIDVPITCEREFLPEFDPDAKTIFDCYSDSYSNQLLKAIGKKLKLKKVLRYHISRHTFATNFLEGDGTVDVLQNLMGHSDIKTTMVYVHITDKRKRSQKEVAFPAEQLA